MFLSRNKKNNVYPCKPQFYYIKVGFKRHVFVMTYSDIFIISTQNHALWGTHLKRRGKALKMSTYNTMFLCRNKGKKQQKHSACCCLAFAVTKRGTLFKWFCVVLQ